MTRKFSILLLLTMVFSILSIVPHQHLVLAQEYDVIVVSAEPEGIAAAVAAARSGSRVLLLDDRPGPGGLLSYGWLNVLDKNFGPNKELLTRGIFSEFYQAMGNKFAFDVPTARRFFIDMINKETRLTALYNTTVTQVEMAVDQKTIVGLKIKTHGASARTVSASYFIDATQDADLAYLAGVPYTTGGADHGLNQSMGVTLVIQLSGVDWPTVIKTLKQHGVVTAESAWGFSNEVKLYRTSNPRVRFRAPNLGRQKDGTVLMNGLLVTGVDGIDASSRREARQLMEAEVPALEKFMQQHFPGFSKARVTNLAPQLYVRETRHIIGEYRLTLDDVLENRMFQDRVAIGSYPVDFQIRSPQDHGVVYGNPQAYSIPYRSLVPLKVDNMLVVGRAASYTSLAAGSARVVPIGMATGQAAGIAANYSLQQKINFRTLARSEAAILQLQQLISKQGGYLQEFNLTNSQANHWSYPYLRVLRLTGAIAGGYHNDWRLESELSETTFVNVIRTAYRAKGQRPPSFKNLNPEKDILLTGQRALQITLMLRGLDLADFPISEQELLAIFQARGWLNPETANHWDISQPFTRGLAYSLAATTLHQLDIVPAEAIPVGSWIEFPWQGL